MTKNDNISEPRPIELKHIRPLIWSVAVAAISIGGLSYLYFENQRYQDVKQELKVLQENLKEAEKQQIDNNSKVTDLIKAEGTRINAFQTEISKIGDHISAAAEAEKETLDTIKRLENAVQASRTVHIKPETGQTLSIGPNGSENIEAQTKFGGIGINFDHTPKGLYIKELLPDGPAIKSGQLYVGDLIIEIDGIPVKDMNKKQILEILRGDVGTMLILGYEPAGTINTRKTVTLKRELIDLNKNFNEQPASVSEPEESKEVNPKNKIVRPNCNFPEPTKDSKIALISAHEGSAVSNISVVGQEDDTSAIPVQIDKGKDKIYLIITAYNPVIWQIKGDTARIEKLILLNSFGTYSGKSDDIINIGATGLPKSKVFFFDTYACGLNTKLGEPPDLKAFQINAIKKIIGRTPDYALHEYVVSGVHILQDRINMDNAEDIQNLQKKAPEGFSSELWERHIRYNPSGLINLNSKDVVAAGRVEKYKVLPKWAGMAKLAYEGAIVPYRPQNPTDVVITNPGQPPMTVENANNVVMEHPDGSFTQFRMGEAFKIVKNIPYYPSGLFGGYSTKFIIANGVEIPKGNAGHSDVILEETGELIAGPEYMRKLHMNGP